MKRRAWTAVDDAELRELYPHVQTAKLVEVLRRTVTALYGRAQLLGVEKSAEYLASDDACRLRRGDEVGRPHRFPKGHVPANKGLKRPAGWSPGRMRETQFKKGVSLNKMPIGSTRPIKGGYLLLKVAEVPNVPYYVNWKLLHVINWERANGKPMPPKHCLRFRDGNVQNCDPSNLELISMRENAARNHHRHLPEPLKRAIYAKGALNRRIHRMERDRAEQHA